MCMLAQLNQYTMRVNLSVALVAMVNQTTVRSPDKNSSQECLENLGNHTGGSNSSTNNSKEGEFLWDTEMQGIILGAFFYGYLVTQLPGGWLADRFGAKHVIGSGLLITSVLTLLTPIAARTNTNLFIALRVLEGCAEGLAYPAVYSILGKWLPPLEVSKYAGMVSAAATMGTVIAMPVSGALCQSSFLGGWPSVFYLFGGLACVWYILWLFLVFNEPNTHPRISIEEKTYICKALRSTPGKETRRSPPWKAILKSMPVWALVIGTALPCLQYYTLLTTLPTYFEEILLFDINKNGFLSALPFLACWLVSVFAGYSADVLREHHVLSTVAVRKIYTSLGLLFAGGLLLAVGFVGCNATAAVVLMTASFGFGGFLNGGREVNVLDFAPYFAGSIYGIVNTASTIPGFVGPYLVGYFTEEKQTISQWLIVFYIEVGVALLGWLFFVVFASGDRQTWDIDPDELATEKSEERQGLIQNEDLEPIMNSVNA